MCPSNCRHNYVEPGADTKSETIFFQLWAAAAGPAKLLEYTFDRTGLAKQWSKQCDSCLLSLLLVDEPCAETPACVVEPCAETPALFFFMHLFHPIDMVAHI